MLELRVNGGTQWIEVDPDRPFCVAVVLAAEGSTPREAGVKAIVDETGRIHGTVGGGCVEAEAQRRAVDALRSGQAHVAEIELGGEAAGGHEPICGGRMRVLLDPTAAKDRAAYIQAAAALRERRRGVLATIIRTAAATETDVIWYPEEEILTPEELPAPIDADAARACLATGNVHLLTVDDPEEGASVQVLLEPIIPNPLLLIAGGGHVGQALAAQAALIGFDVTVIDDRPQFTDPALFPPGVRTHCGDIAASVAERAAGNDTYVVIVTRGHHYDAETLKACIHRPLAYIGMIGSRRKVAMTRQSVVEAGAATEEELDAIHAPIGLDIGAETPAEIATSITAQLIAVRRQGPSDRVPRDMRSR